MWQSIFHFRETWENLTLSVFSILGHERKVQSKSQTDLISFLYYVSLLDYVGRIQGTVRDQGIASRWETECCLMSRLIPCVKELSSRREMKLRMTAIPN